MSPSTGAEPRDSALLASSRVPGPRQGGLGASLELALVAAEEEEAANDADDADDQQNHAQGSGDAFHLGAEQVGAAADQRRPAQAAQGIHQQEVRPVHA